MVDGWIGGRLSISGNRGGGDAMRRDAMGQPGRQSSIFAGAGTGSNSDESRGDCTTRIKKPLKRS